MNTNNAFSIIIASVPFLLLCLLYRASNLKKINRGYQFASMILGLLYSIGAILYSDNLSDKLLNQIKVWSEQLTVLSKEKPQFSEICNSIVEFLNSVNWEYYMIFIINCLVFVVFMVLKRIMLPIFKSIWKNEGLFAATSGICYEWSEARRAYVLKVKCYHLRTLMKVYYAVVVAIVTALLIACKLYPDWHGFKAVFYPFALVIILGEIVFFLDGKTELEFADDIGGEGGSSFKVVNYYRLRKYLTSVFGDRIIAQDTKLPKFFHPHNNSDIVKKYENIDLQEARIANLYFKRKKEEGVKLDEGYVDAAYRLMNGESILFANPFYKDYSDYIFLPLNRAATKGNKILFILGRNGIEDDVIEWINNSFANVICVENMWEVGKLNSDEPFKGDVGIVTSSNIFNNDVVAANSDFLSTVSEVVLIEPSQFVSTSQLSISLYISRVRENATYYVIDKNNDGLVDTISHIIRKSIKEVSATNKERNRFSYIHWKADGSQLNHRIFPNVARYLGVGTELMIAGIRNQVNSTEWYSYSHFPVIDMKWISEQYYSTLCKYASLNPKQEELARKMKFNNNIWSAEKDDYKYIVVEDEFCNMFEMSRQFATRGKSEIFVNVISPNYLLRDYMEYNSDLFEADPKAIPAFCPDYSRTQRNIVIELLLKLSVAPVSKENILKHLRYAENIDLSEDSSKYEFKSTIFNLVYKYFEDECVKYVVTDTTLIEEQNDMYYISNKGFVNEAFGSLKCAYYVLEDEESEKHYLNAKLMGHVYQSHLPGQYIVIGGKYYEILFIEHEKGVIVKRAADSISSREYYRQIRNYSIGSFETDERIGGRKSIGSIIVEKGYMSFSVSTSGYLLMNDYGDIKKALKREISNIPERNYSGKYALKITLPGTTEKIRLTICLLLNEIFKTTYPENSDFICAVTAVSDENKPLEGIMYTSEFLCDTDESIYIIEDSVLDLGLISSIERNLQRFFEIVTDFLKWHESSLQPIPVKKEKVEIPTVPEAPSDADGDAPEGDNENSGEPTKKKKRRGLKDIFKKLRPKKKSKKIDDSEEDDGKNIDSYDGDDENVEPEDVGGEDIDSSEKDNDSSDSTVEISTDGEAFEVDEEDAPAVSDDEVSINDGDEKSADDTTASVSDINDEDESVDVAESPSSNEDIDLDAQKEAENNG